MNTPKLKVLVYGPPGNGKTRFLGSSATVTRLLIMSAESGLLSLRKMVDEMRSKLNRPDLDIDFVSIEKFEDIEEVYLMLKNSNTTGYDAVGMDSLTELQKVCMDKILRDEHIDKARIQDWGTLNNRMVAMLRAFRDLDMHFIVTALAASEKDEDTQTFVNRPLVQGQLQNTLAGYFDEVFFIHAVETVNAEGRPETKRWLQTSSTAKHQAKDRSGMLPRECPASFAWVLGRIMQLRPEQPAQPQNEAASAPSPTNQGATQ